MDVTESSISLDMEDSAPSGWLVIWNVTDISPWNSSRLNARLTIKISRSGRTWCTESHQKWEPTIMLQPCLTISGLTVSMVIICLVSPWLGPSVGTPAGAGNRLYPHLAQTIALKAARALACFHSQGICHGGKFLIRVANHILDRQYIWQTSHARIRSSNSRLSSSIIDSWSKERLYKELGEPQKEPVQRFSGEPPGPSALACRQCTESTEIVTITTKHRYHRLRPTILCYRCAYWNAR